MKKIVLKVRINCQKCKRDILRAVTKLKGINEVSVDDEKGTLTVVGDVDPKCVKKQLKKIGKVAEIINAGSLKAPETPKPKVPETPKPKPSEPNLLPCCRDCQLLVANFADPYDGTLCSIL